MTADKQRIAISASSTDEQLSAAVGEACGWKREYVRDPYTEFQHTWWKSPKGEWKMLPPYATSADALRPLLEKMHAVMAYQESGDENSDWEVYVIKDDVIGTEWWKYSGFRGVAKTFARAACFALLKANGVTVEGAAA